MKKIILVMALALPLVLRSVPAAATEHTVPEAPRGPISPWPWGTELPFPWSFVQGVWAANQEGFRSIFKLRVLEQSSGIKQLELTQLDAFTCRVMSVGVGFERNRTVLAQMSVQGDVNSALRVSLRAFDARLVRDPVPVSPINGQYVVMGILPFEGKAAVVPMQFMTDRMMASACSVIR